MAEAAVPSWCGPSRVATAVTTTVVKRAVADCSWRRRWYRPMECGGGGSGGCLRRPQQRGCRRWRRQRFPLGAVLHGGDGGDDDGGEVRLRVANPPPPFCPLRLVRAKSSTETPTGCSCLRDLEGRPRGRIRRGCPGPVELLPSRIPPVPLRVLVGFEGDVVPSGYGEALYLTPVPSSFSTLGRRVALPVRSTGADHGPLCERRTTGGCACHRWNGLGYTTTTCQKSSLPALPVVGHGRDVRTCSRQSQALWPCGWRSGALAVCRRHCHWGCR